MIPFEPHTGHVIQIPPSNGRPGRRIVILGCPYCSRRNALLSELARTTGIGRRVGPTSGPRRMLGRSAD
jgi:hypothetical protein